jgi:hypothetical protein
VNYQDLQARINTWASYYRGYKWEKEDDEAIAQIRDILHKKRIDRIDELKLFSQSLMPEDWGDGILY